MQSTRSLARLTVDVVGSTDAVGDVNSHPTVEGRDARLEQYWKFGTCSVREILESLPEDERVAYTTVQTLVYRLEQKGAARRVKKIGNAQLFEPAIDRGTFRNGLVRELLDLFGGSPQLLVSNLLESGTITLKDLKVLQNAAGKRGPGAGSVREHLAPALYFLQVHLLYATLVGLGAWALTSLRSASVTAKLRIWTAASLNFALPVGGSIDRFGATELPGAH